MSALALPAFPGASAPTKVWLACGATDMRKGFDGLAVCPSSEHLAQLAA